MSEKAAKRQLCGFESVGTVAQLCVIFRTLYDVQNSYVKRYSTRAPVAVFKTFPQILEEEELPNPPTHQWEIFASCQRQINSVSLLDHFLSPPWQFHRSNTIKISPSCVLTRHPAKAQYSRYTFVCDPRRRLWGLTIWTPPFQPSFMLLRTAKLNQEEIIPFWKSIVNTYTHLR